VTLVNHADRSCRWVRSQQLSPSSETGGKLTDSLPLPTFSIDQTFDRRLRLEMGRYDVGSLRPILCFYLVVVGQWCFSYSGMERWVTGTTRCRLQRRLDPRMTGTLDKPSGYRIRVWLYLHSYLGPTHISDFSCRSDLYLSRCIRVHAALAMTCTQSRSRSLKVNRSIKSVPYMRLQHSSMTT